METRARIRGCVLSASPYMWPAGCSATRARRRLSIIPAGDYCFKLCSQVPRKSFIFPWCNFILYVYPSGCLCIFRYGFITLCIFVSLCVLIGRIFYACISIISCYNFPKLRNEAEDLWVIVNAIFINLFVSVNHGCCRGIYIFGNVPKPVPGRAEAKERQGCTVVKQERKMNLLTGVFFLPCIILMHVYHYGCLLWNLLGRDGAWNTNCQGEYEWL